MDCRASEKKLTSYTLRQPKLQDALCGNFRYQVQNSRIIKYGETIAQGDRKTLHFQRGHKVTIRLY